MAKQVKKGGKKNRKLGRNDKYCQGYAAAGLELRNKRRKMRRHIRRFPENAQARSDFDRLFGAGSGNGVLDSMTPGLRRQATRRAQRKREQYKRNA